MRFYFFKQLNDPDGIAFRPVALHHNVRTSKTFALIIGAVCLALCLINLYTNTSHVLLYPGEYAAAITFICIASLVCYTAFLISKKINAAMRARAQSFLSISYAVIIVISSLWITFVMQHNPSNTMSIFVLGILSVASLWIFEGIQAIVIALLILVLFNGGLHYFQTDPCKLFANYITGSCVAIFFVCISRISFSVNYNHFKQLKKIERSQQDIMRANEMQTEILAVVAHDLRGPINNVVALTELIKNYDETQEEKNEHFDLIIATCSISHSIIEDLLTVARSEETDSDVVYSCVNDFLELTVSRYRKSKRKYRQIGYNLPAEKIYALINHQRMVRVIDNLLSNAWKFTDDDGIISIKLWQDPDNVYISFADNGIGIPHDLKPFLFTRFSKAGRQGLNGEKSYGLGLSICKLIMKQHHGDISVISEEGRGTEIKLTLPLPSPVYDSHCEN